MKETFHERLLPVFTSEMSVFISFHWVLTLILPTILYQGVFDYILCCYMNVCYEFQF